MTHNNSIKHWRAEQNLIVQESCLAANVDHINNCGVEPKDTPINIGIINIRPNQLLFVVIFNDGLGLKFTAKRAY